MELPNYFDVLMTDDQFLELIKFKPFSDLDRSQDLLGYISIPEKLIFSFDLKLGTYQRHIISSNYINQGVCVTPNGSNLKINTSSGYIIGNGINFTSSNSSPNILSVPATTTTLLYRRTQNGAGINDSNIDPTSIDINGIISSIGGSDQSSSLQYIYYVPALGFIITYGQIIYSSLMSAIVSVGNERPTIYPSLINNSILITILALRRNATNLSDPTQAQFFNVGGSLRQIPKVSSGVVDYESSINYESLMRDLKLEFILGED